MRISDWSSDVCSSDLFPLLSLWAASLGGKKGAAHLAQFAAKFLGHCNAQFWIADAETEARFYVGDTQHGASLGRSEERRVGKRVSVRVDLGGRRIIKKKKKT